MTETSEEAVDTDQKPTLFLVCGKIAAGKSTLAKTLAERPSTVLISEDHWTSHLFELRTVADYQIYTPKLRNAMGPHIVDILRAGLSVVLDFPANTKNNRRWMRSLLEQSNADHQMHVILVSDSICKQRLRERNESGMHPYPMTDADYDYFTGYFDPPSPDENFNVILHQHCVPPALAALDNAR